MSARVVCWALGLALVALPAFGQAGQGDGAQTGDGSTPFTGLAQAPEANLFAGAAQSSIPIQLPPGRKLTPTLALQYSSHGGPSPYGYGWSLPLPRIQRASKYGARTCGADRREFVLTLPGGSIECRLTAGGDCIPHVQEAFVRIRAAAAGGLVWTVWDKSGLSYTFGGNAASTTGGEPFDVPATTGDDIDQAGNANDCGYGATWELTEIRDANDNRVHLRWLLDQHVLYPHAIRYGARATTNWSSHKFEAAFTWETRDDELVTGSGGVPAKLTRRLARIDVRYNGGQVRAYTFAYVPGRTARQTFLESVSLRGSDNTLLERGDGAPAAAGFVYHEKAVGFAAAPQTPPRPVLVSQPDVMRWTQHQDTLYTTVRDVFDINGDGFADLIEAGACPWQVYPGSRTGFATTSFAWHIPAGVPDCSIRRTAEGAPTSTLWTTLDLTGDGIPDFIDARSTPWKVFRGAPPSSTSGGGFDPPIDWEAPSDARPQVTVDHEIGNPGSDNNWIGTANRIDLIDMTGDGLPDLVRGQGGNDGGGSTIHDPLAPAVWEVFPNTGAGFGPSYEFPAPFRNPSFTSGNGTTYNGMVYGTFDVNGDGLPDGVVAQRARNTTYTGSWRVCLNSGAAMDVCSNWTLPNAIGSPLFRLIRGMPNGQPSDIMRDFIDINGDGLPDLADVTGWSTNNKYWRVFLNRGDGFEQTSIPWPAPFHRIRDVGSGSRFTYTDTFDIDGDGMVDQIDFRQSPYLIYHAAGGAWLANGAGVVAHEQGMRADLLVASENGIGGATFLHYRPSTQWDNTGGDGRSDLPFVLWTVTNIVSDDGLCAGGACTHPDSVHQVGMRYQYAGGRYDPIWRAVRGFSVVTSEQLGAPAVPRRGTLTVFSQGVLYTGKTLSTATYDARGTFASHPLGATINTWQCADPASGLVLVPCPAIPSGDAWARLKEVRDVTYSSFSLADSRETTTENVSWHECAGEYYGNVHEVAHGAAGGPTLRTTTEYDCTVSPGTPGTYRVDRPTRVLVRSTAGVPLEEKWFFYDGNGNVTRSESWLDQSVVDAGGACTHTPAQGSGGCVTTLTGYDPAGNITSVTDALGRVTTTQYDAATGIYPTLVTQPAVGGQGGYAVQRVYDPACGTLRTEGIPYPSGGGASGSKTEHQYDAFCRLKKTWRPGESTAGPPYRQYAYRLGAPAQPGAPAWLTVTTTSAREPNHASGARLTSVLADGLGRVIQQKSETEIDGAPALVASVTRYDGQGRAVQQSAPFEWTCGGGGCFWQFTLPPGGTPSSFTEYDALARPTRQTHIDGKVRTIEYGEAWQTTTKDECFQPGETCAGNRAVEIRNALGHPVERWQYDEGGTVVARSRFTVDELGRVRETEQGNQSGWQSATRVVTTYDSLGRMVARRDPDASPSVDWTYGYDRNGNLRYLADPKTNQHLEWCYDELGRMTKKFALGGDAFANQGCGTAAAVAYTYNNSAVLGLGQVTQVNDEAGIWKALQFDVLGRVLREERTIVVNGDATAAETKYQYDASGDHLWKVTYPDAEVVTYTYDGAGRIESVSGKEVYLLNTTYDRYGRVRKLTHGNTVEDERLYNAPGQRLSDIKVTRGSQTPTVHLHYRYATYQARGQLQALTDLTPNKPAPGVDNTATYTYDALGRLTTVADSQANGSYLPNILGNLSHKEGAPFTYPSTKPHQPATYDGGSVSHDLNGNRTWVDATGRNFTYDRESRLTEIDGGAVRFAYDHTGRRAAMQRADGVVVRYFSPLFEASSLGTITKYYMAGGLLIAQRDEINGVFAAAGNDAAVRVAARGLGEPAALVLLVRGDVQAALALAVLCGSAALIAWPSRRRRPAVVGVRVRRRHAALTSAAIIAGGLPWPIVLLPAPAGGECGSTPIAIHYHLDRLGSTHLLTKPDGSVLQHTRYSAYGTPRRYNAAGASVPLDPRYRREFTGYETEPYSGLQYAGARFYDPHLGMFQTHDPAREFASPYTYTNWDPVNLTDPTGAWVEYLGAAIGALSIIGVFGIAFALAGAGAAIGAAIQGASVTGIFTAAAIGGAIGNATSLATMLVVQPVLQAAVGAIVGSLVEASTVEAISAGILIAGGIGQSSYSLSQGDYFGGIVGLAMAAVGILGLATQGANRTGGRDWLNGRQFANNQNGVVLNDAGGGDGFWSDYVQVRPENGDGYLTLGEAKWQWQHGEGAPVTVDANKLDLSGLGVSDFPRGPGSVEPFALPRWQDFIVHGTVSPQMNQNSTVSILPDTFNFDLKPWSTHFTRNIYTLGLRAYVGSGTPYPVHFRGTAPIGP